MLCRKTQQQTKAKFAESTPSPEPPNGAPFLCCSQCCWLYPSKETAGNTATLLPTKSSSLERSPAAPCRELLTVHQEELSLPPWLPRLKTKQMPRNSWWPPPLFLSHFQRNLRKNSANDRLSIFASTQGTNWQRLCTKTPLYRVDPNAERDIKAARGASNSCLSWNVVQIYQDSYAEVRPPQHLARPEPWLRNLSGPHTQHPVVARSLAAGGCLPWQLRRSQSHIFGECLTLGRGPGILREKPPPLPVKVPFSCFRKEVPSLSPHPLVCLPHRHLIKKPRGIPWIVNPPQPCGGWAWSDGVVSLRFHTRLWSPPPKIPHSHEAQTVEVGAAGKVIVWQRVCFISASKEDEDPLQQRGPSDNGAFVSVVS